MFFRKKNVLIFLKAFSTEISVTADWNLDNGIMLVPVPSSSCFPLAKKYSGISNDYSPTDFELAFLES